MRIVGLIAEYNPFHRGHQYHLDTAREMTNADGVIIVMSGDFVQRGLPAVTDKYRRAAMALAAGADAVFELPVTYATGSAERFASGAVRLLHEMGAITDLVYGCECGDRDRLLELAALLLEEPEAYRVRLKEELRRGRNFPAARSEAAEAILPGAAGLLSAPNNILAVEYEKALLSLSSPICSHSLRRRGAGYHESASVIRRTLVDGDAELLSRELPETSLSFLDYWMEADDFSALLAYRLRMMDSDILTDYQDVTPGLAARIRARREPVHSFLQLASDLKTRDLTLTHVQRALLHILLGIKKEAPVGQTLRLLGFRRETQVLSAVKAASDLPMLVKMADDRGDLLSDDRRAADIYRQAVWDKYQKELPDEYHAGPVIL